MGHNINTLGNLKIVPWQHNNTIKCTTEKNQEYVCTQN